MHKQYFDKPVRIVRGLKGDEHEQLKLTIIINPPITQLIYCMKNLSNET